MTKTFYVAVLGIAFALNASSRRDYRIEDKEPVHHIFTGDQSLDSDTVNGTITVIGDGGNTIRVDGERIIRADDQADLARAKKDDVLDINEKNGIAQLFENGPFRNSGHTSEDHGFHDPSDRRYEVEYNLTIHVPRETGLRVRTVNGGVQAQDTSGIFDVKSVNGVIGMTNVSGSGAAAAVNGANIVSFHQNPRADSAFTSVNGRIELTFHPDLSADLALKTVNGGMYTDFESSALAPSAGMALRENGKFVYKSRGTSRLRIGSGGPQLRVETVNGSIQIKKATK